MMCPDCKYPIERCSPRYTGPRESMEKLQLDTSDPAVRAVYEACLDAKRRVATWPSWKLGRCNCPLYC